MIQRILQGRVPTTQLRAVGDDDPHQTPLHRKVETWSVLMSKSYANDLKAPDARRTKQ